MLEKRVYKYGADPVRHVDEEAEKARKKRWVQAPFEGRFWKVSPRPCLLPSFSSPGPISSSSQDPFLLSFQGVKEIAGRMHLQTLDARPLVVALVEEDRWPTPSLSVMKRIRPQTPSSIPENFEPKKLVNVFQSPVSAGIGLPEELRPRSEGSKYYCSVPGCNARPFTGTAPWGDHVRKVHHPIVLVCGICQRTGSTGTRYLAPHHLPECAKELCKELQQHLQETGWKP